MSWKSSAAVLGICVFLVLLGIYTWLMNPNLKSINRTGLILGFAVAGAVIIMEIWEITSKLISRR